MKFEKLAKMEADREDQTTVTADQATLQLALSEHRTQERSPVTRMDHFKSYRSLRYEIARFLELGNSSEVRIASRGRLSTGARGPDLCSGLPATTIRI